MGRMLVSTEGRPTGRDEAGGCLAPHRRRLRCALSDRRGAAAVEFALTLPFMLLLAVGAFDYGNVAYTMMEVNQAAHAGAFYAYANPSACTTSGITTAEKAATNLGSSITTTTSASGATAIQKAAPACGYNACVSSAGVIVQTTGTCPAADLTSGDQAGTYAIAYAQTSFSPLLPWTQLAFPSTLTATAVIRYK
jgi:Flp pilus assembly protein TadG